MRLLFFLINILLIVSNVGGQDNDRNKVEIDSLVREKVKLEKKIEEINAKVGLLRKKILDHTYPTVTLIVPVYNEESIISKKLQNIKEIDYPNNKMEVIFVDGHSTDRTPEIIIDSAKKSEKPFRLIKQDKRNGYTRAVIEGIKNSRSEIIVATDAASYYYPDTILHLVKHFTNSRIGAVTGREVVLGNKGDLGPQLEKSYRFFYDFMRAAETEMDSTPDSKGEILAVKKEICNNLIEKLVLSPNASFDSCVPYQASLMGYRTIYDDDAKYYEFAPSSFSDRMTQQVRRATLLIGAMLLFKEMLLNRKYAKFGLLILPAHFIMNFVLPSIFLLGLVSFGVSTIMDPLGFLILWIVIFLLLIVNKSRALLISFVQSQFALFVALFMLARRRQSLFITSIPSTRFDTRDSSRTNEHFRKTRD